ncbi:protein PHLOEM PROTEIN 2-LIKE A1-like [Rhodamnia argentea]|uniref:Protein PHLOEM PROTEIN 2-LIKE A1-like n=1 Tax=Rhodamnia argentea TaxID=178133 RepID=A0A8B8PMM4_9MYRT|nr:protein PHLOEM PROTEIN 2-LIKE A1-like [Rhodamnia argentea]
MAQEAMSKYRQFGFLVDAGVEVSPDEYLTKPGKIDDLLRKGAIYKDKKKRFWVDGHGHTCFTIYAKGLHITNGDRPIYWQWTTDSDRIEVAKALKARWLEVKGSFWTMDLSPETLYKVSFLTRMEGSQGTSVNSMAEHTVSLRLTLPDGNNQERQAILPKKEGQPPGPWHELEVGLFTVTTDNVGKMEFSMQRSFGRWMGGLVIGGVEIKPV